jgi:hypothetical protein
MVSLLAANPHAAAAYCGYQFVDLSNRPLPQIEARRIPIDRLYQTLLDANFLVPEAMFVRRACYELVGLFDESLRACEDWDMWLRIAHQHKIISTDAVLTRHRILPASMSSDPTRMYRNRMAVIEKHCGPEIQTTTTRSVRQQRVYGQGYLTSAVEYLQLGEQARAYECFRNMAFACSELLTSLNTYYELGCGNQPKGFRGDFASLDIPFNGTVLLNLLDRLFGEPQIGVEIERCRKRAYASAYRALGLLSYGAGRLPQARGYLMRALAYSPRHELDSQLTSIFMKSLLSRSNLDRLRRMRRTLPAPSTSL